MLGYARGGPTVTPLDRILKCPSFLSNLTTNIQEVLAPPGGTRLCVGSGSVNGR
jgi:hypothetical protein